MVPARYFRFVFSFLMSLWLSSLMSGIVTLINTGIDAGFVLRWGHSFVLAWPVAFSLVLISAPTVQKIARLLVDGSYRAETAP
ncbi:MAG: DUF2798 domain-containing protein [Pseudomonadota bacterium]